MARNCQEAVELAQQQLPDLIFMDIKMPVMDGFEATRKIKSMEPTRHIPGIAANSQTFGENPARPPYIKHRYSSDCPVSLNAFP